MMRFKVTLKNQLIAMQELIIMNILYFGLIVILYLSIDWEFFKILFYTLISTFIIIYLLPVLILHINYLKYSVKNVYIDEDEMIVENEVIKRKDVQKIIVYATMQYYTGSGGTSLAYNEHYFRLEVILKSGKILHITSLLDKNIDKIIESHFPTIKIEKKKASFLFLLINQN